MIDIKDSFLENITVDNAFVNIKDIINSSSLLQDLNEEEKQMFSTTKYYSIEFKEKLY